LSRNTEGRSIAGIATDETDRIHVTVPGSALDPRLEPPAPLGVEIHRGRPLHPEEVVVLPSGLRVTSVARTLVDLADELPADELREAFAAARERGLLDMSAVHRSRARVEWRPSLATLDTVISEFDR
jgi:hypothetical protein